MPTKKQLHFMLKSDLEFGHINDRGSEHNAIGEVSHPPPRRPAQKAVLQINIPAANTTLERMKEICEYFNLECTKKRGDIYTVQGTDPMEFFWLGANITEKLNYPDGRKLSEIIQK